MIFGFNVESLNRHKVSAKECLEVLADACKVEVEVGESKNGNPTIIYVGLTAKDRLLEVGVEYLEDMDWIYHASSAGVHFRRIYKECSK